MFSISGESFGYGKFLASYDFNDDDAWEIVQSLDNTTQPKERYGITTIVQGNKIFVYGSVVHNVGITNELWTYDILNKTWEDITKTNETCIATKDKCVVHPMLLDIPLL